MGWSSKHATFYNKHGLVDKKAECDAFLLENCYNGYVEIVKSSMFASDYYAAVSRTHRQNNDGEWVEIPKRARVVSAMVIKTAVRNKEHFNFSWKVIPEEFGPCEVDCPILVLKSLTPTEDETVNEWRETCRRRYYERKEKRALIASLRKEREKMKMQD